MLLTMKKIYSLALVAMATTFASAYAGDVTFDPPSGSTLKYIETIDFSYPEMVDNIDKNKVYVTNNATGEKTYCTDFVTSKDWMNYMKGGTMTFPKLTEAGDYTLTMEEGAVQEWYGGGSNPEATATYTVNPNAEEVTIFTSYNLTPDPENPLAVISMIQLKFPKITYWDTAETNEALVSEITLTGNGKTYYGTDFSGYYGSYSFSFSETPNGEKVNITEPGTYTLFIPAGIVNNDEQDPEAFKGNPAITAEYVVSDDIEFAYTCDPANGSTVSIARLDNLTVKIYFGDEVSSVSLDPAIEGAAFSVTMNGQELQRVENVNEENGFNVELYGTSLSIRLSKDLVTEPSEFHITAPKGAFTVDGLPSPVIDYTVTYTPPKEFTYEIAPTPDTPVLPFREITIYFTNAESIYKPYYCLASAGKMTSIRPGSTAISSVAVNVFEAEDEDSYPYMVVSYAEDFADDNYIFTLPKGEILLDGEDSPAIECLFIVDSNIVGVSAASAADFSVSAPGNGMLRISNPEGSEVNVFTLEGRKVCRLSDREAMVNVAPGYYIVALDGKSVKILVK